MDRDHIWKMFGAVLRLANSGDCRPWVGRCRAGFNEPQPKQSIRLSSTARLLDAQDGTDS